ncbi:MAG: Crp/Fnr family transcriptional regulator [Actinomycetota bacterium]|nr:Crp/Fnr family transcriptional regulator [Actinomycetota bacterium]
MPATQQEGRIALLDAEPDLGAGLSADEAVLARRVVAARTLDLDRGPWTGDLGEGAVGAIVLSGLLAFGVPLDGANGLQLRGIGDVVLTQHPGGRLSGEAAAWAVAEPARLAVLDETFVAAARRWPPLVEALLRRLSAQDEALAVQHSIAQLPRVDQRLRALLWQLAQRWGTVTRAGIILPLALTHEVLGQLVGSRRPTVSLALGDLAEQGLVLRQPDRSWLLTEDPPGPLPMSALARFGAGPPPSLHLVSERLARDEPPPLPPDVAATRREILETARRLAEAHRALNARTDLDFDRFVRAREQSVQIRERVRRARLDRACPAANPSTTP